MLITIVLIQLEHVNKNPLLCLRSRNSGETRSTKQKEKTLIFHILIIYIYIYIYIYISFVLAVQYLLYIYQYMKEWRKNPQWSLSCCLALLLPLNELQGEIRGLAGKNILKQQLQTGKIDMPSMSKTLKDSGAVAFGLGDDESSQTEESDHDKVITTQKNRIEQSVLTLAQISIHELPKDTYDTAL